MKINKRFNKIIKIIGIISIALLTILVYISNAVLGTYEIIQIFLNNIFTIILLIAIFVALYIFLDKINNIKLKKKTKTILFIALLIIYLIAQILWINIRKAYPIYDQYEVYNDAKIIAEGNINELIKNEYLQMCPHQITLITFYALIFKVCGSTNAVILQYLNAIANTFTILGLYLIAKIISDKKNTLNSFAVIFLSVAFIPLSMLSTFVYGDMLGLAFGVFSTYFVIKYVKLQKIKYLIISGILMSLACYCRTNMLIFFIALTIYLLIDYIKFIFLTKEDKINSKFNKVLKAIIKIIFICLFIIICLLPTNLVKSYMSNKLQLAKENQFPTIGHINHGISYEGYRGPGWYVDKYIDEWKANGHNNEILKERVKSFINEYIYNPIRCFSFFINKIVSIWNEPTFGSVWYNTESMKINDEEITKEEFNSYYNLTLSIKDKQLIFIIIGKIILIIIYSSIFLLLIRNKNITNEQMLLILIFLGGFAFQLFWEGKSRYILPFVLMLIPLASIGIKENIQFANSIIKDIKSKRNMINLEKSRR